MPRRFRVLKDWTCAYRTQLATLRSCATRTYIPLMAKQAGKRSSFNAGSAIDFQLSPSAHVMNWKCHPPSHAIRSCDAPLLIDVSITERGIGKQTTDDNKFVFREHIGVCRPEGGVHASNELLPFATIKADTGHIVTG